MRSSKAIQEKYRLNISNKYETLMNMGIEQYENDNKCEKIDFKWQCLRDSIIQGNINAPKQDKKSKQPWMTCEILNLMTKRKK